MTVQTSITLTRDQAERCMREDAEFEVRAVDIFHMTPGGDIQYFNLNFNQWRPPFNSWQDAVEEAAKFNNITIHSDPNNTYDKLFGKTDMTNETEQKYLTRSEALKAMEEGERVREVVNIQPGEFWMKKGILLTTARVDVSAWQTFGRCTKFVLVPQPDSPEKFVREFHATCPSGPLPQHWEDFIQKFFKRSDDLIEQMDKEGK